MEFNKEYTPNIIDFAYQIIDMDKEINYLRLELDHYKELVEILREDVDASAKSTKENTNILLSAILDPKSFINRA